MPLWEPDAELPQIQHCSTAVNAITTTKTTQHTNDSSTLPNPDREAARMAALKKLRHQFLQHCAAGGNSKHNNNKHTIKPPVLAFERWLGRAALRQQQHQKERTELWDPILPCDGHVCQGLIQDLTRHGGGGGDDNDNSAEAATIVATLMAKESESMAQKIASKGCSPSSLPTFSTTKIQEEMKQNVKTIQTVAKLTRKLLKKQTSTATKDDSSEDNDHDDNHDNHDDDDDDMKNTLLTLQQATQALHGSIRKAQYLTGRGGVDSTIHISDSRRPGIYDVALVDAASPHRQQLKKPYLTVSSPHLEKIIHLWNLQQHPHHKNKNNNDHTTTQKNGKHHHNNNKKKTDLPSILSKLNSISTSDNKNNQKLDDEDNRQLFLQTLYGCLARYEGLKGAGYQCAVPGIAFDAARSCGLGITIECFASPLNCRYAHYCSAFPDLECRLGSLGSFFDDTTFFPSEGSFEVNPPFIPDTMHAMGDKLVRMLEHEEAGPLSFLVVIPAWGAVGIQFVEELETSMYNQASLRVPAAEHAFCDGAQHTKPSSSSSRKSSKGVNADGQNKEKDEPSNPELRPSSWDTAVILLQNDKGSNKWSVTTSQLEDSFGIALRKASKTIPEAYATLDAWEQRGVSQGGTASGWNGKRQWKQHQPPQNGQPYQQNYDKKAEDNYTSFHANKRQKW